MRWAGLILVWWLYLGTTACTNDSNSLTCVDYPRGSQQRSHCSGEETD